MTVGTLVMLCGVGTEILFRVRASDFAILQSFHGGYRRFFPQGKVAGA